MFVKIKPMIREVLSMLSPKMTSKILYKSTFGKKLNLKKPITLNEKLMWLKLNTYYNNSLITMCADKYRVREYIKELRCDEILNELIGSWDKVEDIDWANLPDKFVLKCNHGAGYNLICEDKNNFNIAEAKIKLTNWLKEDYWKKRAELNYKFIEKKIICEKFIETNDGKLPVDYKVYCFNGKPDSVMVYFDRGEGEPKVYIFNKEWNLLDYTSDSVTSPVFLDKPKGLDKMFKYAEKLSSPFPFVRVDFYLEEERVIFGELTFTPGAALYSKILPNGDEIFGRKIKLPV